MLGGPVDGGGVFVGAGPQSTTATFADCVESCDWIACAHVMLPLYVPPWNAMENV